MDTQQKEIMPPNIESCLHDYKSLAYSLAASYSKKGLSLEDLQQEALIGLIKAFERYKPEQETKFSTYAVYWIKKQILSALDRENRQSLRAVSLDQCPEPCCQTPNMPSGQSKQVLDFPSQMPELEVVILRLSLQEKMPLLEIAKRLGISSEGVKQVKQKAIRRLRSLQPPFST